ncbi:MAG: pyridoxamine 5'-phosphate oxidase family protein [Sediminibacterium sp.]|nr:pyridoxamine 5'-phosphate oxidase family protein [Sediminibacterium sp.]
MQEKIYQFIKDQTCTSICTIGENSIPHCFTCYYAYNKENNLLYYKSSIDTQHAKFLAKNPIVAGTILPDKFNKLQVKGIQFSGLLLNADDSLTKNAVVAYYLKYPLAAAVSGEVWVVQVNQIKYTDNTLGFGTKLIWERI